MRSTDIVNLVGNLTFENAFNPYSDRCRVHDTPDAPGIRRQFLREILRQAHRVDVDAIWVGRDLGYRGGRRTGLALTDDIHFSDHLERWGLEPENLTTGEPVPERTAGVIWDVLHHVRAPVFLWNVFPLHPFRN
ncbi:MAG: uracil-DNA glycosylase, partial [Rhodobacteraceae bacterium]|nr:uracil-DNA glycosylase [Paracoccaceae bacterium]